MRVSSLLAPAVLTMSAATLTRALPRAPYITLPGKAASSSSSQQQIFQSSNGDESAKSSLLSGGASHLSEWCRSSKTDFLSDIKQGKGSDWLVVVGNEAGDLDSLVSAIALAYDLNHTKGKPHQKAVAMLQVEESAIDLRPENKLALEKAGMERGHKDLLAIEELPYPPAMIGQMIQGIVLVDHNRPLSYWGNASVFGIVDHHHDRGTNTTGGIRIIEPAGSCSSLVASHILSHKHTHGPIPRSLGDLLLYTIAIDTKGLKKGQAVDIASTEALWPHSHYSEEDDIKATMKSLGKEMKNAKNDLDHLTVWQLIQRDWKGDIVFDSTIPIHLGFASIPYSFADLIAKTPNSTLASFFDVERSWAHYNQVDIAILLTSFKDPSTNDKRREIIMTVKDGHRIDAKEAERLFNDVKRDIEASEELELTPWNKGQDLGQWKYAWTHGREDGGRKIVRPLVEKAVQRW